MTGFEILVDRPPLRILALPGQARTLVIAFASIGHDSGRPPSPEFVGTATAGGRPALFVIDESRSWGSAAAFGPALTEAIEQVRARQPIDCVAGIGQSMGGFAALVAATKAPFDVVLAIGPQSSIDPGLRPEESRWRIWTERLDLGAVGPAPLPENTRTILMHGWRDDRLQALGFVPARSVDHILFPEQSHSSLCPHLKQRGVLGGLLDSAISGDRRRLLRLASGAGGVLRKRLLPY